MTTPTSDQACPACADLGIILIETREALERLWVHADAMRKYYSADIANEPSSDVYAVFEDAAQILWPGSKP